LFEPEVITEAVHAQSQTIDSRHFAEEFVRRHKLASSGVPALPSKANTGAAAGSGGWSEVAKKTPVSAQPQSAEIGSFKVVAGKKKGKR
jgi:PERQ amino acid-rich with GYF domain-containing protein